MGLINFLKEAGEKLFHHDEPAATTEAPATAPASAPAPAAKPDLAQLNQSAATAIRAYVEKMKLPTTGIDIRFDGASRTVTVSGQAPDQTVREKIVLCCGNVAGVLAVDDQMSVAAPAAQEARYREVRRGDTLSKIAQEELGDANAYMKIFEANKPMLSDPDKIYPGQKLRIPA